jgi:hypothetical protein
VNRNRTTLQLKWVGMSLKLGRVTSQRNRTKRSSKNWDYTGKITKQMKK